MSQSTAVTADHLRRLACLYVRQSSLQQVQDHQEEHCPAVRPEAAGPGARLGRRADRGHR